MTHTTKTTKDLEFIDMALNMLMDNYHETTALSGEVFTSKDGSFGIIGGGQRISLETSYFFINSLAKAGLFTGEQKEGTSYKNAANKLLTNDVFKPYPEVSLFWNEKRKLTVKVETNKNRDEILKSIFAAIDQKEKPALQKETTAIAQEKISPTACYEKPMLLRKKAAIVGMQN